MASELPELPWLRLGVFRDSADILVIDRIGLRGLRLHLDPPVQVVCGQVEILQIFLEQVQIPRALAELVV